jgi:hypothetical protein
MEEIHYTETSVGFITRRYNTEYHIHCCENLKYNKIKTPDLGAKNYIYRL